MTVQYTYVYGEALAPWTDVIPTAQYTALSTEIIGTLSAAAPNSTASNLFAEVIHDIVALPVSVSVPILIACT